MFGVGIFAHTGFVPATPSSLAAPAVSAIKSRRRIPHPASVSPEIIAGAQVWEPPVGLRAPKGTNRSIEVRCGSWPCGNVRPRGVAIRGAARW